MSVHIIRRDPNMTAAIRCSCGYTGPASMCPQHLYDVRVGEAQAEIDRLREAIRAYLDDHGRQSELRAALAEADELNQEQQR